MTAPGDLSAPPSNAELARIFHEIGDMLEVKGELVFKTVAYHKAADAIAHSPVEVSRAYLEGRPPRISGVGRAARRRVGSGEGEAAERRAAAAGAVGGSDVLAVRRHGHFPEPVDRVYG